MVAGSEQQARGQPGGSQGANGAPGVLRRLLAGSAPAPQAAALPQPAPASVERSAAVAVARAASRAHGLPVSARDVQLAGLSLAELPELLPEGALIAVVEGPGERLGVVALSPAVIASLIEMQATGRISARPAPARRATRTDAALAAGFVNLLLEELSSSLRHGAFADAVAGLRYASYLDDPRPLALMLEDGGFHGLTLTLRLGAGGEREGTVLLAVPGLPSAAEAAFPAPHSALPSSLSPQSSSQVPPALSTPPLPSLASAPGPSDGLASTPRKAPTDLSRAVLGAPIPLIAVLCRRSISLRELRALQPGAMLTLARGALGEVIIETEAGQRIASGRLGEAEGSFAVRVGPATGVEPAAAEITDVLFPAAAPGLPMDDIAGPDQFRTDQPEAVILSALPIG